MANSPFRATDSWTGEQMEFKNYDAYIAYMDKKESSASKTAKKTGKDAWEYQMGRTFTADSKSKVNAAALVSPSEKAAADNPTTFKNGGKREAAAGGKPTLDQAAKESADKEAYSPTGIWEFDLGYAAGRARKKKIDAAGGKEAFKSAKRQKRKESRAISKEKQLFKPMGEMQKITSGPLSKVNSSLKQSSISRRDNGASKSKGKTKNTMGKMQKITSRPLSKNKPSLKQSSISSKKAKLGADMKKEGNFYKKMLNSPDFKPGRTIYTDQKSITAARKRGEIY